MIQNLVALDNPGMIRTSIYLKLPIINGHCRKPDKHFLTPNHLLLLPAIILENFYTIAISECKIQMPPGIDK
jgi:hypothetical protein